MITSGIENAIETMDGWCSPEKARAMMGIVEESAAKLVVEIGVFGGRSLVALADACRQRKEGHVYGIDPWSAEASLEGVEEQENLAWWSNLDYEHIYAQCLKNVRALGLEQFASIYRTTADRVAELFEPESIDLLHIDGNHSEPVSSRDVVLYLPLVRQGGYVLFDDMDWHSTRNAVRILREGCDHVGDVGNCGVFRKQATK